MDGVTLPYLPVSLWILTGAMTILILFVAFGFYIHWRNWAKEVSETGSDVASLKARKLILEKEKDSLEDWLKVHKDELDRVKAEREEQERIRAVLADLEQQCAVKNQENQALRNEVGELENQRHHLAQTLDRMQHEIGDLDAKRTEAEAIDLRLAEMRSRLQESQQTIRNLAELEVKLNSLSNEKASLERGVEGLRAAADLARTESSRLQGEVGQSRVEAEQIARELLGARKEKAELGVIIDTWRQEQHALERSTERLEQRVDDLKISSRNAQEEATRHTLQARQAMTEAEREGRNLATFQKDRQRVEMELGELNARKAALEQEIFRIEGKLGHGPGEDGDPLVAYADLLEKKPLCLTQGAFAGMETIETSLRSCSRSRQHFAMRALYSLPGLLMLFIPL